MNLPANDKEIRAYSILQVISKIEMLSPSPYEPENDARRKRLSQLKAEYYQLLKDINEYT